MKIKDSVYEQTCKKCPYMKKAGNRRICVYGTGCAKGWKRDEIKNR